MSRTLARIGRLVLLAAVAGPPGCGPAKPAATGTRAAEAAQAFFEGLARRDWPAAYERLDPESQARAGPDRFARLGEQYRRNLRLEPAAVHVTACEEHGSQAIAHVTLSGNGPHRSRFKDTAVLRRADGAWGIVLPAEFGLASKP